MGDHRRNYVLKFKWLLLSTVISLFLITEVSDTPRPPEGEIRRFFKVETFFRGSDQEVEVYRLFGREEGPTVLIFAGIHGDESGGHLAADRYIGLRLEKGNLIIVPRLNLYAILTGKRTGLSGRDMNRKFHSSDENRDPDDKVVSLAKSLMDEADVILNLHQGHGCYFPSWIDRNRNPVRWGQCKVIDISIFDLPDGRRLELERVAREVARKANATIEDKRYHFHVNNTDTLSQRSVHREQRQSLTFFALARKHKMAFGIEATKSCPLPQSISYLTMAVNAMLERTGIEAAAFPSASPVEIEKDLRRNEAFSGLRVRINGVEKLVSPKSEILLAPGDRFQVLSVEAEHTRGWYPSVSRSPFYNGMGKTFSVSRGDQLILHKYGKKVAVFPFSVKETNSPQIETSI
ncbi:MAG: hypothetical protein A2170_13385 [Deltaproteobacteria bacterium RBG_13_53_10]|nr:MAG: hypothetical protein A2170_13385 [Deltaproteobacteria bacterium RBG_13_53_10]